jgi:hypothetical protein
MPPSHSHQDASGKPIEDPHSKPRARGRYPLTTNVDHWPALPIRRKRPKDPDAIPSEVTP